jgi:hypothetical protein
MWPFKKSIPEHIHEFRPVMRGKATITRSWFGGRTHSQEEVITTLLACPCGEHKATMEGLDGVVKEINPMFIDMNYNSKSPTASGVHTCES